MRMRLPAVILVFTGICAWAQIDTAGEFLASRPESTAAFVTNQVERLASKRHQLADDRQFLSYLFYNTHKKVLKVYRQYATLEDLATAGKYDCLTGTALYALLLDRLGFDVHITETNHHIFLLVHLDNRRFLLEATDPAGGFISDPEEIDGRMAAYKAANNSSDFTNANYTFGNDLFREVSFHELTGLLLYNQAVNAYNHKDLTTAVHCLDKASQFYQSPRIEALYHVILTALPQADMDAGTKAFWIQRVGASLAGREILVLRSASR